MTFSCVQVFHYLIYNYVIIDVRNRYAFDQQGINVDNWS